MGVRTVCLLACLASGQALGQATAPTEASLGAPDDPVPEVTWSPWSDAAPPKPLWELRVEPQIWYAAPAGEVKLPGSPESGARVEFETLGLDSPRLSPAVTATLQRGPWRFGFEGSSIGIEAGATMTSSGQIGSIAFAPGDTLQSSLRLTSLEATGGYRLFEARRGQWGESSRLVFGVDAFAGVRALQFDLDVQGPGGSSSADEWFFEPLVGADVEVDLWESVSVGLKVDGGLGGAFEDKSIGSGSIEVGFAWRPWRNVGATIGYRLEAIGLTDGEGDAALEFSGSSAGLLFGLTLRF